MTMFQNKLRFYHTTNLDADRSTWREVFPLGSKAYEWKKDKKEVFYRQDKKGGFLFTNFLEDGTEVNDFDFFNEINNDILLRCATRYVVTEKNCDSVWTVAHIGKFTMNDCDFDLDVCTIKAKQSLVDEYSCLKENKGEKFNILNSAPEVTVFSPVQNNFDFLQCRNSDWLSALNLPCDGTGGWKKFFQKTATNTPQPALTIFNQNTGDDYDDCLLTKNHAVWRKKVTGVPDVYSLEFYRFADSSQFGFDLLDAQSTLVIDSGMVGFTTNALRDFKVYRPDTNTLLTIVANHPNDILWFDIEDDDEGDDKFAFFYDDNDTLFAYDFTTTITRVVDTPVISTYIEQITGNTVFNISYGEGVLVYHNTTSNELNRYSPSNFIVTVIQTVVDLKFLYSEDGFITWFNIDDESMFLQNRDDTTFENILLRFNDGDCRYFARENQWIVFDDESVVGVQIAINLTNREVWSVINSTPTGTPVLEHYKIENGWFLFSMVSVINSVSWLDTKVVGNPSGFYSFTIPPTFLSQGGGISMSAGIERIFVSGSVNVAGTDNRLWSIDMDTQVATEIENIGTLPLNCLLMNNNEQALSTHQDRVNIVKENIQPEDELQIWFREKTVTISVGGIPTPPSGGWSLYHDQSNQFGTAIWVRQPALSPPPLIDIAQGGCVCTDELPDLVTDEDECLSISPNVNITDFLMNATTTLTVPTIRGIIEHKQPVGQTPFQSTYYIENPRDGSTYSWTVGIDMSIISGQGTPILIVGFQNAFSNRDIECQETNPCAVAPIPLATLEIDVVSWNGLLSGLCIHNIPDVITPNTYSGGTGTVIGFNATLSITGESSSTVTFLPDGRRMTKAIHNGVASSLGMGASVSNCPNIGGSIAIVSSPSPLNVISPLEVCPTGVQTYHIETPRDGCQYSWTVDSPCFIVGSNIGTSVVVDMNGSTGVFEQLHLSESCPVQSTNYQIIAPCNELHSDSWWWIIGQDVEYNNGRLLKNVIEDLVSSICPEITTIRSDFFQWNPLNPSLIHYVYGGITQYNYLTIHQKSDVKNPTATENATIGNLTWKEFTEWMRLLEVYYIVIDGELHIEHISRFIGTVGLDTTILPSSDFADFRKQFSYDKFEMARIEEFKWMEEQNAEFVGFPIEYKDFSGAFSLCVNEDTKDEEFKELTTDLKYIQTNPADISNKGFVILANIFDGVDYNVIEDAGIITGIPILNSPMSISVLQDRFLRFNRILPFGNMNRNFTNFESSQFFKKQKKFKIPFCCDTVFNAIDLVRTTLGEGQIESAEIDFESDTIELKLKYE